MSRARSRARRVRAGIVLGVAALAVGGAVAACRSTARLVPRSAVFAPSAPTPAVNRTASGGTAMRVVLDDPRLAGARERERAKDWPAAAAAIAEARAHAELDPLERCAWDFTEGRLLLAANASPEAAAAFERAAGPGCPLAGWATLRAGQAHGRAGHADEAIAHAQAVPADLEAARDDVKILLAEALFAKGDRRAALPLWRAWLAANPHGSRWVDTSVKIANALLDGIDGPKESHAREAYDLTTKVVAEAPKVADAVGATTARARAVELLRSQDPASAVDPLPDDARARQAQAWLDTGESKKALELAVAVLATAKRGPIACKAAITRANAATKLKQKVDRASDPWVEAVAACEKDEQLVTTLYTGAKARAGKDPKLAMDWFRRLEQLFPSHRLADDARYRGALILASEPGSEARAEEMLRTLPDAYPHGDMRAEALFKVALGKMQRGEWDAARPLLDRIVEISPDDRHWATAGRAEYFRGRAAAALGDRRGAEERFARIVERYPLAFYMRLAYARLDRAGAERALAAATTRDEAPPPPATRPALLGSPGFLRAVRLLEVGEIEAGRRELHAAGALADAADPEVVWSAGALFNQAGAPEVGHVLARPRATDYAAHYPVGRWRAPWEVAYPRAFEDIVTKACTESALPSALAWAIMREESNFVADAKSHANAVGLMQLMGPTAKWIATGTLWSTDEASLKRPEVSIDLGVRLLAKLRTSHGHPALAIGAYNGGSGAVERWMNALATDELDLFVELVPYDETRNYVKRVLASQAAYAYLYDPPSFKEPLALRLRSTH